MKPSITPYKIAMLSVHTCPLAVLGGKEAGGMNVYVRELSKELGRRGIEVDIFTRSQNPITTFTHTLGQNVRIVHLPAGPLKPYDKNQVFRYLPQFVENIHKFKGSESTPYDVIHGHYWLSGWAGLLLRKKWRVPVVQMFHTLAHLKNDIAHSQAELEPLFRAEREGEIMQQVDRIITATPVEKAQLSWRYSAPAEKIETIPCGVDLKLFRPVSKEVARARVMSRVPGIRAKKLVLLVGRIEPIKGVDVLIEAVRQLRARWEAEGHPATADELQILIVGGGTGLAGTTTRSGRSLSLLPAPVDNNPEATRLRLLVQNLGLADQVLFVPSQPQEQMPYFYSAADLTIMSSHYESFGMAALESQACGTPVIASRAGGLPFAVQDNFSGRLVEPGQPQELAETMAQLLDDDGLRRQLGQQAASRAEQFGWRSIANNVIETYMQLAAPASREKLAAGLI